jgi:hypothetical protein
MYLFLKDKLSTNLSILSGWLSIKVAALRVYPEPPFLSTVFVQPHLQLIQESG